MAEIPDVIKQQFFEPFGLNGPSLNNIMAELTTTGPDLADIYFDYQQSQSWNMEDSTFKNSSYDAGYGAGLRAIKKELIGFASTTDLSVPALMTQAQRARLLLPEHSKIVLPPQSMHAPQQLFVPEQQLLTADQIEPFLVDCDNYARSLSPHCQQVLLNLSVSRQLVLIYREDGRLSWDDRPMLRFNCTIVLQNPSKPPCRGYSGGGGRCDFQKWFNTRSAKDIIDEALRLALVDEQAEPAPMGSMPVILGAGWPGVLIHEAVGHGLEADFIRKKSSIYHDQLGQMVASEHCTIIDDGQLPSLRGSLGVDDEGEPTQCTTLIKDGVLKQFLFDRHQALLMGRHSTGNGRRESALHCPMPRMTNTYLASGNHNDDEMIASVAHGIYAVNFGGGSVDITSGQFVFSASEAYLIENGRLGKPLKGATLIGHGPSVLKKISMVGAHSRFDPGIGVCGKNGQGVPVTVGQPAVKVDELVVGGTHG